MTNQNYNLINSSYDSKKIFIGNNVNNDWITWTKPPNTNIIYIKAIGGGGGGGGGQANSAGGTTNYGSTGGGCASVINTMIPAFLLPDTLYIKLGVGGSGGLGATYGGASAQNGGDGTATYVSIFPNTEPGNMICSASFGRGGVSGNITTNTLGSSATASISQLTSPFCYMGINSTYTGRSSSNATQFGDQSTNQYPYLPADCGPGSAGGGWNTANPTQGSTIKHTLNANQIGINTRLPDIVGGVTGTGNGVSAGDGQNGFNFNLQSTLNFAINNSYNFNAPLISSGGAGGGGGTAGASGGKGGDGGFGSGGGGGGSASFSTYSPRYGGNGGNGGPGLVIIQCI